MGLGAESLLAGHEDPITGRRRNTQTLAQGGSPVVKAGIIAWLRLCLVEEGRKAWPLV